MRDFRINFHGKCIKFVWRVFDGMKHITLSFTNIFLFANDMMQQFGMKWDRLDPSKGLQKIF